MCPKVSRGNRKKGSYKHFERALHQSIPSTSILLPPIDLNVYCSTGKLNDAWSNQIKTVRGCRLIHWVAFIHAAINNVEEVGWKKKIIHPSSGWEYCRIHHYTIKGGDYVREFNEATVMFFCFFLELKQYSEKTRIFPPRLRSGVRTTNFFTKKQNKKQPLQTRTKPGPVRLPTRHPTSECNFGDPVTPPTEVGDSLQVDHESHHRSTPGQGIRFILQTQRETWRNLSLLVSLMSASRVQPQTSFLTRREDSASGTNQ